MKRIVLPALIALSLIANAALVLKLRPDVGTSPAPSGESTADNPASSRTASPASSLPGTRLPAIASRSPSPGTPLQWTDLPIDDLHALVDALRAQGFPPDIVRAIISTRVNTLQRDQQLELQRLVKPREYWRNTGGSPYTAEYFAAQRALNQERTELLTELLGEMPRTDESLVHLRNRFGNLSAEKIEHIQMIQRDYSELTMQVQSESQGMLLPEDRQMLAYLEREQRADLQTLLTPAEYDEYMLRSSTTSANMRSALIGMEPNEQEFRQIFALQLDFDDEYGPLMRRNIPEWQAQYREAEQQLIASVKATLGEERGADYERSRDSSYTQAMQLTQRMQLSKEAAHQTWEIQRGIQQQSAALTSDRTLTPEQRNARMAALLREARTNLASTLGDDTAQAYQQQPAGIWLRSLEQRANNPPSQPPAPPAAR